MAEAVEDVSKPEVDKSEETVEEDVSTENNTDEAAAVDNVSAAGDAGNVATDISAEETAAADSVAEEDKNVVDASAAAETIVVSEDNAVEESVISTAAADDDDYDGSDVVAVVTSEVETDDSHEAVMQPADETLTVVTPSDVEEKPESVKANTEADATTDRVEHVTSKADKVTMSVETPTTDEVSKEAVPNAAVTVDAAVVSKTDTSDTSAAINKTTQDVIKMAGNDELKFGVIIGLVRIGQLSNKDVVDSVLSLVSSLFDECFGSHFCWTLQIIGL